MGKYLPYVNLAFSPDSGETLVNIRQTKVDGSEHFLTVSGADLSPLMYQLKSIEASLIFGSGMAFQQQPQQQHPEQRVQDELAREIADSVAPPKRPHGYEQLAAWDTLLDLSLLMTPPPPPSPKTMVEEEVVEEVPPSLATTKGHLRKWLRDSVSVATSTGDLEKAVPPTSTVTVKKKKKKTEVITVDAATRLRESGVERD